MASRLPGAVSAMHQARCSADLGVEVPGGDKAIKAVR